ncbi:Pro-Pol polyprotein [Zancudomyces culisetae]|uniref:Pro-Pol polyprotein n=1 Tax=Zancudomyces culisetae TaxID=1213189 RepID=A0A1R1PIR3_ZANCU|nr:Pro-Pol polyprotein [Zancudomyces culisetae]|eukprot:OMH80871.1 Pro-Pol polyprotein [Zancudomyces culisetae]
MKVPETFDCTSGMDPKEWVGKYRIIAKLNKWDEVDWIDFVQLHLGKRELVWYKRNTLKFTSWEEFTKQFITKFGPKDQSLKYLEQLKTISQEEFETIEELEYELEELLTKSKITEEKQKLNWLLSALTTENRIRVRDAGVESWTEIVELISKDEQQLAIQRKPSTIDKENSKKQTKPRIQLQHSGRPIKDMAQEKLGYGEMVKKMEEWSLNLLTKVDELMENKLREHRRPRQQSYARGPIKCFKCGVEGHKVPDCPEQSKAQDTSVNFIELSTDKEEDADVFAVQRGIHPRGVQKPYDFSNKRVTPNTTNARVPQRKVEEMRTEMEIEQPAKPQAVVTAKELVAREDTPKSRNKLIPKITEGIEPFSLVEDLKSYYPHISLPQLIQAAPQLTHDMSQLAKKVKKEEINEIRLNPSKTSNCKIEITIFGRRMWAIVDTGAACSVATPNLVYGWGLITEQSDGQVIVTADGRRHAPRGIIRDVPVQIGKYIFATDITIMERTDDILILGTDWLLAHKTKLDMQKGELALPVGKQLLLAPLYTRVTAEGADSDEAEVYLVISERQGESTQEVIMDPRVTELMEENKELFIEDVEQLTQTDVTQHRIELTHETPIRQRPYRIPFHLYEKDITGRVARWAMILRNYNYSIVHCMGKRNPADALSRLPANQPSTSHEELDILTLDFLYYTAITTYLREKEYPRGADEKFREKLRNKARKYTLKNDRLCRVIKGQVKEVLHEKNIEETIQSIHAEGHHGIENTWLKVKEEYTGEGLYEVVKKIVNECITCQRYKGGRTRRSNLNPIFSPRPFSIFGIDAIGPINPVSKTGNRFILTGIDYFTKWPVAAAWFGVPSQIITDRGSGFVSDLAEQVYKELGIRHTPTTPYRPQSNGQVERLNQTLKNALVRQCRKDKQNWDKFIWKSLLAIRTMRNKSTKYSPAELLYGVQIATPSVWTPPPDVDDLDIAVQERIDAIKSSLPEMRTDSVRNNVLAKERDRESYNKQVKSYKFNIGDLVLKMTEQTQSKLEEIWEGLSRLTLGTIVA